MPERKDSPSWQNSERVSSLSLSIVWCHLLRSTRTWRYRSIQSDSPGRLSRTRFDARDCQSLQDPSEHLDEMAQGKRGQLKPLKDTVVAPKEPDTEAVELDEVWSFVHKKGNKQWVWLALSYQSRQVLAMVVGDRSESTCRKLWERLPPAYRRLTVFTDFYQAYQSVVPKALHHPCGKDSGLTNTVERFNNTLRQRVGRMVRKTLSFSKSAQMHLLCLRLFIDDYNRYCVKRYKLDPT